MQKHSISAFIDKTWTMLETNSFSDIVRWTEDGNSFKILNEPAFQHTVLPAYFKHSNLTSFQRQLNMYNFHKKKTELGHTEYYHRLFKRNQRELLKAIRRKPSEDQIEIGEELLRKLALAGQETHQHDQTPHIQHQSSIENNNNIPQGQGQQESPRGLFNGQLNLPYFSQAYNQPCYYFYYFPNQFQIPQVPMVYNPEKLITNHVLINNGDWGQLTQ